MVGIQDLADVQPGTMSMSQVWPMSVHPVTEQLRLLS